MSKNQWNIRMNVENTQILNEDHTLDLGTDDVSIVDREQNATKVGVQGEWFPLQDRSLSITGVKPRIGFYTGLNDSYALLNATGTAGVSLYSRIPRIDFRVGTKLAFDIPVVGKGLFAPYLATGLNATWYSPICPTSDDECSYYFPQSATKPTYFLSGWNPEIGIDVMLPLAMQGVSLLVNGHVQMLNYGFGTQTDQLFLGGAVGVAF